MTTSSLATVQRKKKELKGELVQIEKQIYDLETTYLEETRDFGNIFTGWELYGEGQKTKAKKTIQNEERHFSLSSVTSPASRKEENKKKRPEGTDASKKSKKSKSDTGEHHADDNVEEAE